MQTAEPAFREETVLILAPTSKDAALSRKVLEEAGIACAVCRDLGELCVGIDSGAGVAMLGEEALTAESLNLLRLAVRRQPAWSDFPLLILTQQGADFADLGFAPAASHHSPAR